MPKVDHVHIIAVICTSEGRTFLHRPDLPEKGSPVDQFSIRVAQQMVDFGAAQEITGQEVTIGGATEGVAVPVPSPGEVGH